MIDQQIDFSFNLLSIINLGLWWNLNCSMIFYYVWSFNKWIITCFWTFWIRIPSFDDDFISNREISDLIFWDFPDDLVFFFIDKAFLFFLNFSNSFFGPRILYSINWTWSPLEEILSSLDVINMEMEDKSLLDSVSKLSFLDYVLFLRLGKVKKHVQ